MNLVVVSHKPCWHDPNSPAGYVTDGGFPLQIKALSELFDHTRLLAPVRTAPPAAGVTPLTGHGLTVVPLTPPAGQGVWRKAGLGGWLARNGLRLFKEIQRADAVHTPIPGDVGTFGMLLAFGLQKPLFVRHCGNWLAPRTAAERFWKWFMVRYAGGKNVMLATGGAPDPPAPKNQNVRWIFSTSLSERLLLKYATPRRQIDPMAPRLIIACRQEWDKGTQLVIKSLPLILQQAPQASLDVVGDGTALAGFKALAVEENVAQQITFHGKVAQPRVMQLLQQADLFCYPTAASEGFPKVVLEALACGLPVITTPVSVLPQLIGRGGGLILDPATPAALAQAVQNCLANQAFYSRMSRQAIETAKSYSLESWRDTIGAALQAAWGSSYAPA